MAQLDQDSNIEEVINVSSETVKFEIDGLRYKLNPRERVKIHKSYALDRRLQKDKDPVPSVIELLTGKRVLSVSDPRARAAVVGG